jgi:hypothetical protein
MSSSNPLGCGSLWNNQSVYLFAVLSLLFVVIPESSNRESIKINQFSSFSVIAKKHEVFSWQSSRCRLLFVVVFIAVRLFLSLREILKKFRGNPVPL